MNDDRYERTLEELEKHAGKWWPREVREEADKISILHTLLETQDQFISILKLAKRTEPEKITSLLDAASIPYNLFLKHLMVLSDFGSEPLQRIGTDFNELFPNGKFSYDTGKDVKVYRFKCLPVRGKLTNKKMKISTVEDLEQGRYNAELCEDLIMIVAYGASATQAKTRAVLYRCVLSEYFGQYKKIDSFVKQGYIRVSRIIAGKTATDLGNTAQQYVVNYLAEHLGENYNVKSNGTIPGVTQNDGNTLTSFDVVIDRKDDTSRHKKYVAVEVTFQETTNSTIERKGGQARDRFEKITSTRNFIAYIIDGAGNFSRTSAVSVLCDNSHCTVAYTPEEFHLLLEFIREKIG